MMSNSNYIIGLQRLKPVHTAYNAICMPIRELLMHWHHSSTSRDGHETEKRPRRDVGTSRDRDVETETTTLKLGTFNVRVGTAKSILKVRDKGHSDAKGTFPADGYASTYVQTRRECDGSIKLPFRRCIVALLVFIGPL